MLTCLGVAQYFLVLVDREAGDLITQLKLQKLVYFAQGISLKFLDKPLFPEPIEAWKHGPVVRELRKAFGKHEDRDIPEPAEIDFDQYSDQEKNLIYKVYAEYGEHTASYLRNLTHEHPLWEEARHCKDQVITQDKIKAFFKTLNFKDDFLVMSDQDKQTMMMLEDQWWMSYESGIPSEDITEQLKSSR